MNEATPTQSILDILDDEDLHGYSTEDMICEWAGCEAAEIHIDGTVTVWGHFDGSRLTDTELCRFAIWVRHNI